MVTVYRADAGFVMSEMSIVAHVNAALQAGAEIHGREAVKEWEVRAGTVHAWMARATYEASHEHAG